MFLVDLASPADGVALLQRQINATEDFSNNVGLSVNLKKNIMAVVFRNGGPLRKMKKWYIFSKPI